MLYLDFEAVKIYLNVDQNCAVITIAELIQITDAYLLGLSLLVEKSLELEKVIQRIKLYKEEVQKEVEQDNKDNHIDVLSKITLRNSTSEQLAKLLCYLYRTHEQIKDQPRFRENNKNILQQIYTLFEKIYNYIIDFLRLNKITNSVFKKKNSFSLSCCFFNKMVSSVQVIEKDFSEQLSPARTLKNFQWKQSAQIPDNNAPPTTVVMNPCSRK